jgi:quercetin dioxygenase-like cupin family protein
MTKSERPLAIGTKQLETDRVIVTEWAFAPGAHTGWHRHGHDYVVVPITTGDLTIESAAGVIKASMVTGTSYNRNVGVEHDVINDNPFPFRFIEIEMK